jgi:uncharacterized Zn finger protein (UPF0148 family)
MDKELRKQGITFCPHCQKHVQIESFFRDDPVMSCGHVLMIEDQIARDQAEASFKNGQRKYNESLNSFKGRSLYLLQIIKEDGIFVAAKNMDILWT